MRKLCKKCQLRPCAINYYRERRPYYRSQCDHCAKGYKTENPRWMQVGYKKKDQCDKCGFKSRYSNIFNVFYVDGDLNNNRITNLKTVCANCQRILHTEGIKWKQGDLTPDL